MSLVAGIDSSTQSTKVLVVDGDTGEVVRSGQAPHPPGTEVDPAAWQDALSAATAEGLLDGVAAVSVAGQQHGMVALDEAGSVVRPALLWNDVRSAPDAADLVAELGGPQRWAESVGSVPVASLTVTKLRWLARCEPDNARRVASVLLPHDWLTRGLTGGEAVTDRGDASGTGYWSPASDAYDISLLGLALGRSDVALPRVLGPSEAAGETAGGAVVGPGTGDNAGAALGLAAGPGDVVVSVGTSGVVSAVADQPTADVSGLVAGFADATGRFLPLACTLNATQVLDAVRTLLGVSFEQFDALALSASPGAGGLVLLPYFAGERTPDLPTATGRLVNLTVGSLTPATLARAAVEGVLCGLADGLDAIRSLGVPVGRVLLVGGGARSRALQELAPGVLGVPVEVPQPAEYVALGAARQAAWVLSGAAEPPAWVRPTVRTVEAPPAPAVRDAYAAARDEYVSSLRG
ncbi:MAG: xylulokinase [Actinomycetes bacterium]